MAKITAWTQAHIEWEMHLALALQMVQAELAWQGAEMLWPEQVAEKRTAIADAVKKLKRRA